MTENFVTIKAVIFDCFGVLTADKWKEFCASLPKGRGLDKAHELNHAYYAGLITREGFLDGVRQATGRAPQEVEQLLDNEITKNTTLLNFIARQLKPRYKIGLLSNVATPWITDHFLTSEEQALFDEMVFSFEVGMTKPDPRIFALICERLEVELPQAVMIDDIERYCQAARNNGMQAITYNNFEQTRHELEQIL